MESWRQRVNEALDSLLAARVAESCLRQQLDTAHVRGATEAAARLRLLWRDKTDATSAARVRVEAVLWE